MKDLLDYLQKEWGTLSQAPLSFLVLFLLAFATAYLVTRWRYEGIVESLRERHEAIKERLAGKDEQLDDYRQRLHLIPISGTAYSQLSNSELKQNTLQLVNRIRDFLGQRNRSQNGFIFSESRNKFSSMTEEERDRAWNEQTNALMQDSLKTNSQFDQLFKVDSILLRDELLSRLPRELKNESAYRIYEHPTNPIGMGMVADDLERLAKSLSTTQKT